MTDFVLDASAVLALVREEPGAAVVAAALSNAHFSAVNLAEALTKLVEYGFAPQEAEATLLRLQMLIHPFDHALALEVATLRSQEKKKGLSLGERACLALTRHLALPVLTADRLWLELDLGLDIRLIR